MAMITTGILGDRIVCPACSRAVEADLFRDRRGELCCGQCGTRRKLRRGALDAADLPGRMIRAREGMP